MMIQGQVVKRIQGYHDKHVKTYLHDVTKLEQASEVVEDLKKRNTNLEDLRIKVRKYQEFQKILYEGDQNAEQILKSKPLQCVKEMDKCIEMQRVTANLWEVLKYWRKKRQMCFTRPFFELDLAGM